jgi:hypothetical protein
MLRQSKLVCDLLHPLRYLISLYDSKNVYTLFI